MSLTFTIDHKASCRGLSSLFSFKSVSPFTIVIVLSRSFFSHSFGSRLSFLLLLAHAKSLTGARVSCGSGTGVPASALVAAAKRQVDYILGANPAGMSYMVEFGARYPRHVHHRGASMPSVRDHPTRIGCDEGFRYLHSPDPDANVLVGAVVGGPDGSDDAFTDSRDNYA
jgi:hypothetical protein